MRYDSLVNIMMIKDMEDNKGSITHGGTVGVRKDKEISRYTY